MSVKVNVIQNPLKVRVGQTDAVKVVSSNAGGGGGTSDTAINVIGGIASVTQLNVSGISTLAGITSVTGETLFTKQFNVSGVSSFTGIVTTASDLYVGGDLFVGDDIVFDEVTGRNLNITGIGTVGALDVTGTLTAGLIDGGSFWWQNQVVDKN